jgi:hypothetical protein
MPLPGFFTGCYRGGTLSNFLDYQFGRYVAADALRAAGARVEVHIDHFAQSAPDYNIGSMLNDCPACRT